MALNVLGIDLAAEAKRTCACTIDASASDLTARLHEHCDDASLLALAEGRRKVAIDAPFGWPDPFVQALVAHRAMEPWPVPEDSIPGVFRAELSFRATDRVVQQTRRPLSVSTDKVGVTAMRCALLQTRWAGRERVDRTGHGRFMEVYPAAALQRWGLPPQGYKGDDIGPLADLLRQLRKALPTLSMDDASTSMCARSHDAFDALICALVAVAASLRLTDGPAKRWQALAAREGWIHLPLRGSLQFLASSRASLSIVPQPALAEPLRAAGVTLGEKGYASRLEDVLVPAALAKIDAIRRDLAGKGGSELVPKGPARRVKVLAAHSSALLAANHFGPFLESSDAIPLDGTALSGERQLEAQCPTGLNGPATLDFLIDGEVVIAVESKCVEPFDRHEAKFASSYRDALASLHRSWAEEHARLVEDPRRYRFLDAAQLIKHYVGLRRTYPKRRIRLIYAYWRLRSASAVLACAVHEAEVAEFTRRVRDPSVRFRPLPYDQLWEEWASPGQPGWLRAHAKALRKRYDVSL